MLRRPMMRRGPGLVGAMVTTAVVAGTATAVSRGVAGSMERKAEQKAMAAQEHEMAEQQRIEEAAQRAAASAQQQPIAPAPAPAAQGMSMDEKIAQLQKLGELVQAGILTPEEFAAQKAKVLAM